MLFNSSTQYTDKKTKLTVALLVFIEPIATTVYDHIDSFSKFSMHNVQIHNLFNAHQLDFKKLLQSDIIVIHYTVSLFSDHRFPIFLRYLLSQSNQLKILFIQDEYRLIDIIHSGLNYLKIDVLFTCVPETEIEKVYPTSKLPFLRKKINVLTGYVPENLLPLFHQKLPYEKRKMDVVYRARKLSSWYGRLGQEKWTIVPKFLKAVKEYKLNLNLSCKEKDRIYGNDWIKFLQNSKAALGVESGASVFDFTGKIQQNVENYEKENPTASFEEIEEKFFPGADGKIYLNQISPRCFECAALGTLMILYEGKYSGILKPWHHYIPLKKDFSNIAKVIESLQNKELWEKIILTTYNEIALNSQYSYKKMIDGFDNAIADMYNCNVIKNNKSLLKNLENIPYKPFKSIFLSIFFFLFILRKSLNVFMKRIVTRVHTFFSPYFKSNSSSHKEAIPSNSPSTATIDPSFLDYLQYTRTIWIHLHNVDNYLFSILMFFRIFLLQNKIHRFNFPFMLLIEIFKTDLLALQIQKKSYFDLCLKETKLTISFDKKNEFHQPLINRFYKLRSCFKKVTQIELNFPTATIELPENLRGNKTVFLKSSPTN